MATTQPEKIISSFFHPNRKNLPYSIQKPHEELNS